jgi:hypothetical protein
MSTDPLEEIRDERRRLSPVSFIGLVERLCHQSVFSADAKTYGHER